MATAGELHPTEGIRLLLLCREVDESGTRARYAARVYTPEQCFEYRADLEPSGAATLAPVGEEAAPDHRLKLENLVKSIARAAGRKAAGGLAPWPPRVLRWRGPGRG